MAGGLAAAAAGPADAKDWYVDAVNGSNSYTGAASSHGAGNSGPWATIDKACSMAKYAGPGDIVHVLPTGPYVSSARTSIAGCARSGTQDNPITFRGEGAYPNLTKIVSDGSEFALMVRGSYQTWTNFEVTTSGAVGSLFNPTKTASDRDCIHGTPGGSVSSPAPGPLHHIIITGNVIHGCGGNGIDMFNADYVTISQNVIYGNARTTRAAFTSGVTILGAVDSDTNTGTKIIIDSNVIYGNTNVPYCLREDAACLQKGDSDGNGIILDVNDLRYDRYPGGVYPMKYAPGYQGRMLVVNNVIFGNGGRCIHAYRTKHVDIANNTCYRNLQDPYFNAGQPAEIDAIGGYAGGLAAEPGLMALPQYQGSPAMSGGDIRVVNNAIYADGTAAAQHSKAKPGACIYLGFNNAPSSAANNQCFLANGSPSGAYAEIGMAPGVTNTIDPSLFGALYVQPGFKAPSLDPSKANLHPAAGSRLLGAGNNALLSVATDTLGIVRAAQATTIGAYER